MTGLTLDAGALIAVERDVRGAATRLQRARAAGLPVYVPAGVVGQVWRDGRRQTRISKLLTSRNVSIVELDGPTARTAGTLCGATGTSDVIDATVVICARKYSTAIITSDPDDLRRLDPSADLIVV